MGILYAEQEGLTFTMNSVHSNITYKNGWADYFRPFCKEFNNELRRKDFQFWETSGHMNKRKRRYAIRGYFQVGFDSVFTHQIWWKIWGKHFEEKAYSSPKYGFINLSGVDAATNVLNNIWNLNEELESWICNQKKQLGFDDVQYVAVHMRRGDKVSGTTKEADEVATNSFADEILKLPAHIKTVYVLTDDYARIGELQTMLPADYKIITLCERGENGYDNGLFTKLSPEIRFNRIKRLLLETEICRKADFFIGTYVTNLSKLIVLLRNNECSLSIEGYPFRLVD